MTRRDFIVLFGVGWVANYLPIAIATTYAAQPEPQSKLKSKISENWLHVATVEELDKMGQLLNEKSPVGPILIIGTSKSQNLIAVNPTCTHLGCKVEWESQEKIFLCPCHASEFGVDGKVLNGPATKPLNKYAVKIIERSVLVRNIQST